METVQHHPRASGQHGGLELPELFKSVLSDLSQSTEAGSFGYNIDVLTPQNYNDVMFSGFQEVFNGTRSAKEQAARCRRPGRGQRKGKTPRKSRAGERSHHANPGGRRRCAGGATAKTGLRRTHPGTCRRCGASNCVMRSCSSRPGLADLPGLHGLPVHEHHLSQPDELERRR